MEKEKTHLPENVKLAGLGRRTLAVIIDAAIYTALAFILYYTVGTNAILKNNDYQPALDEQKVYIERSGMLFETASRGTYDYVVYTDAEDAETSGDYAYKKYRDLVWKFFMEFLPANTDYTTNITFQSTSFDGQTRVPAYDATPVATDAKYGKWVYTYFFGYDEKSTDNYFIPSVAGDYTSAPADGKDGKEFHAKMLQAIFDSKYLSGHYVDACRIITEQPFLIQLQQRLNFAGWAARLPSFIVPPFILFMLVPLFVPGGKTLGKLICSVAIIGKDGYAAAKINLLLRQFVLLVIWGLLALPWPVLAVPLFMLMLVVEYISMVLTSRHTGFHDLLAGTIAVDAAKSTWFASKEDEDDFIAEHPQSPMARKRQKEEETTSPAYLAAQAQLAAEESILDLSTINKRREEARAMISFDDFERQSDAKFEQKKAEAEKKEPEEKEERDLTIDELAEMEGISKEEAAAMLKEQEEAERKEAEGDSDGFTDVR